jgi:putative membrane protein
VSVGALGWVKAMHVAALLALLWASLRKNMLLSPASLTAANAQSVVRFDKLSAGAAGVMLLTGLAMALWLAKPLAYYVGNPAFWLKMAIFVVASGLIVWTKLFIREARSWPLSAVPISVRWVLRFDFAGILVMAALGLVVAHGF